MPTHHEQPAVNQAQIARTTLNSSGKGMQRIEANTVKKRAQQADCTLRFIKYQMCAATTWHQSYMLNLNYRYPAVSAGV